jgi:hypothetical protein
MSSVKVLEATVRPRTDRADEFGRYVVAAFQSDPRIDAVELLDAVLIATIWYPDLDRAAEVIAASIQTAVVWSAASIRYRHETVQSNGRVRHVTFEPMMLVETTTPQQCVGLVIGDLSSRRGLIMSCSDLSADTVEVLSEVPLSELRGYDSFLAEVTNARGVVTATVLKYNEAPPTLYPPNEPVSMVLRA